MKDISTCIINARQEQIVKGIKRKVELFPIGQEVILGAFADEGRVGDQTIVYALAKHNGGLYAGVGANGHVYLYDETDTWIDCGQPGGNNAILCLFVFGNNLYAGTDYYAKVYRYVNGTTWVDCGSPAGINQDVFCLTEYNNEMYAGTKFQGRVYRYVSGTTWVDCGKTHTTGSHVKSLKVYNDRLYAGISTTGGEGHVCLYNGGTSWTDLGRLGSSMIVYCLGVFSGNLYGGTQESPSSEVYRYDGDSTWTNVGLFTNQASVYCLKGYRGKLFAGTVGSGGGILYYYTGGMSWTSLGVLGSSAGIYSFAENNNRFYVGTASEARVFSALASSVGTEIVTVKRGIGRITDRVERKLNQFQAADISITAKEPVSPIFFKSDQSGLFDKENLRKGYQVKVSSGIEGCDQWVLKFDGKLKGSVKRPIRERATFSAMGWLDNAKRYNAELVADKDNPPFKNISGITFISMGDGSKVGAKIINHGIDSDVHWLQFDNGDKINVLEDETIDIWDSVRESHIFIEVDHSELPGDDQEDSFSVIEIDGVTLKAVGWWENIPLGTENGLVSKILTECGVTEQDIRVEEIEGLISQEKNFIFMNVSGVRRGNITAFRVVEIDETNKIIRALVGITAKVTQKCYVYLFTINYDSQTCNSKLIFELDDGYKAMKFMKFGNKWWVLISSRNPTYILPYTRSFYHAYYLKNFDSNWDVDYSFYFPSQLSSLYNFTYACSGSVLESSATSIYFMGQKNIDTNGYSEWYVKLFKLTYAAGVLTHTFIKTLEMDDSTNDKCFADEWASLIPESSEDFYYYGIRHNDADTYLEIRKYALSGDAFTTVKDVGVITGYIENFTRSTYANSSARQGYFIYQESSTIDRAYWIGRTGILYPETREETIKNLIYGNPDFVNYYFWWHYDTDGYHYIKSMYADTGGEYKEVEKLDTEYSIEEVASEIFKGTLGGWNYVGIVMEKGSKVIKPFLYMPGKVPIIEIADFTGMNCKNALTKLAEGFCCNFNIYEMTKGRFYFRGTTGGEMTLDSDQYIKQPVISYWENQCDGVIVENSEKGIRFRKGNTGFGDRIIEIDSIFVSSRGMAKVIAEWLYAFFNERRLLISVEVKFLIEIELFDKITTKLRNKDGTLFREIVTIVIETSFEPSPYSESTHRVSLKLLQLVGDTIHIPQLIELDETSEMFVTV